jgi:NF-X1-type zinc finger protein NFXL1
LSRPSRNNANNRQREITVKWGCPKCRHTYSDKEIPTRYTCFCGKVVDPQFDPWNVPHSCGETCGKPLKPDCGHQCLILCHPGPCPPCPKVVKSKCYCGQTAPATKRCFDKNWSCGKPCSQKLSCQQHLCPIPCHEGNTCPPCNKKSVQLCLCQRHQRQCDCSEPQWSCQDKCGKKLACGYHMCEQICHSKECPPCPLSQLRTCPCGKSQYQVCSIDFCPRARSARRT